MIESITIADTPPFNGSQRPTLKPRKLNYVFGANGVGKTTISRIVADPARYQSCTLAWKGGQPTQALVLNRDFVDQNFGQLKGIFTLGEEQKDTQQKIEQSNEALQSERDGREQLRRTLEGEHGDGGKKADLADVETELRKRCWAKKREYDELFKVAFKRYRDDGKKFKGKVLTELSANTAELKPFEELAARADTVFGTTPTEQDPVPDIDASALIAHESDAILKKVVVGKADVDIADMIEKLGHSDWIRQGRSFYEANDGTCPFCQQTTTEAFAASLETYFDETYEADIQAIDRLATAYASGAVACQEMVSDILATPGEFVDVDKLQAHKSILDKTVDANLLLLENKKAAPSQAIELNSVADVIDAIKEVIQSANSEVQQHNRTVRNIGEEKRTLTAQVWRFMLNELQQELTEYDKNKTNLDKAITSLETQLADADIRIREKTGEIRGLERQIISIQPTIDYINGILVQFGFTSFTLAMGEDGRSYKLIRDNGEEASKTLSEGEKTFVVFLYFYHLLQGSMSESGITTDRIVVFDDPVSSLDSDILFIVSSLIRGICENAHKNDGHVKQVFVFTHNIYFHREVTFRLNAAGGKLVDESFWVVRKRAGRSSIEEHPENPIKTSYELLWSEVREANPGIENTLRRILEYYFKILGGTPLHELDQKFEGKDKLICNSLVSWVHAGSHHVHDALFVTPSDISTENYLRVFRQIFEKSDQSGHYRMMMGEYFQEESESGDGATAGSDAGST